MQYVVIDWQQCISDSSCLRGLLPICLDGIHCSLDDIWPSNTSWCWKLLIYRCLQFVEINISVCLPVHGHLVTSSIIAAAMWEFRSVMLRVAFYGLLIVLTFTFHHQLLLKLRETNIFHVLMTCADEVVPICPHWSFYVSSCLTYCNSICHCWLLVLNVFVVFFDLVVNTAVTVGFFRTTSATRQRIPPKNPKSAGHWQAIYLLFSWFDNWTVLL